MHKCVWRTNKFHPFVRSHDDDDMGYDETLKRKIDRMHTCVWRTNKFHPFVRSHDDDDMGYDETL